MPRDGSNIYHRPPGTDGIPDTTIESAKYNAFVADVEQDLNLPRPIVAGGTGASSADQALQNLSGEKAKQIVTNFDATVFVPGSFYSAAGAIGSPVAGHAFGGIVYPAANGTDMVIEARDLDLGSSHEVYWRGQFAGAWSAWVKDLTTAAADAAYVNVSGDTMTGSLSLPSVPHALDVGAQRGSNAALGVQFNPSAFSGIEINSSSAGTAGSILTVFNNAAAPWAWTWDTGQAAINVSGYWKFTGGLMLTAPAVITAPAKGHTFGGPSGTSGRSPVALADANIILYNGGPTNWAGIGTDNGGEMWFKTGISGNPVPPLIIKNDLVVAVQTATPSTSPTTGALTVAGGVGIGGALNIAGHASIYSGGNLFVGSGLVANSAGGIIVNGSPSTIVSAANAAARISFVGGATQYGIVLRPGTDGTPYLLFTNSADVAIGQISGNGTNINYITSSDARLKENLKSFDAGNIIDDTNVYNFTWKRGGGTGYGVIAQEANEVYPDAVTYNEELDFWGVDYSKYVPVLLQELKALRARVVELEVVAGLRPAAPTPKR